ncbi:MAG: ABC transporter permease [Pirellulales bacterium]
MATVEPGSAMIGGGAGHNTVPRASTLGTWWTILRISIEERLVYRGDFALGTLMRFLPLVTQVFFWSAIFGAVYSASGRTRVAGYTNDEMIAYLLLTQISRAFSSMPNLANSIALQIRNGEIKKFLVQPVDLIGFLLLGRVAHKLVYYLVAAAPFALVFYLCRGFFSGWPEPHIMVAFIASLVMAFLLGYFLEATLGLIGFWWLEVSSLLFIYMLFNFFFSGHMFPIDMLDDVPGPWATLVRAMPLQYLAYFPAAVFLGKVQGAQLVWGLLLQVGWVVVMIVLCRLVYFLGVKRYSGFGG